jgi:hypothetical protein
MKNYITSFITIICALFWFTPWIFDPHKVLLLYLIAFFWFFFISWIILIVKIIKMIKCFRKKEQIWTHHLISGLIIIIGYIIIIIAIANNLMVSV